MSKYCLHCITPYDLLSPLKSGACNVRSNLEKVAARGGLSLSLFRLPYISTIMEHKLRDFTNVFVFSASKPEEAAVLSEIPKTLDIDPARQRRGHRKSLAGCDGCKRRHVKVCSLLAVIVFLFLFFFFPFPNVRQPMLIEQCDEQRPCAACRRRGESCIRSTSSLASCKSARIAGGDGSVADASRKDNSPIKQPVSTSCEGLLAVSSLPPLPSHSSSSSAVVNLLHLRLFHHFQTHTKNVLPFASSAWDVAVRLSWEHAFLADALLCVAARHLAVLQQDTVESAAFASAAATHLCRALSGFRYSLTTNLAGMPFDVFIASSILLQIELWTSTEFIVRDEAGAGRAKPTRSRSPATADKKHQSTRIDFGGDRLFAFSASLKQVLLRSGQTMLEESDMPSAFIGSMRHDAIGNLVRAARLDADTFSRYRTFFSAESLDKERSTTLRDRIRNHMLPPVTRLPLSNSSTTPSAYPASHALLLRVGTVATVAEDAAQAHAQADAIWAANKMSDGSGEHWRIIDRLCLILSFLPEAQRQTQEPPQLPLGDLSHCIFSFPILCRGPFNAMLQEGRPASLLIFYHFYRAICILLPGGDYWWAHGRASVLETAMRNLVA